MKKTFFITGILLFFGLAPHVFAQGFVPLATIPGLTDVQPTEEGLAVFFNNLYKYLIGLAAAIAVVEIIWGGLEYSTQDSISKKSNGKERIQQAIFGLVLVLSPALVFSIINPSILNLSLNLKPLDTRSVQRTQSSTAPATLSEVDLESRQQWDQVFDTFTINSNFTPNQRIQALDAKQLECNQQSGGTGVVLPNSPAGGGVIQYVCQACPQNTALTLYPPGKNNLGSSARGARGSCN